MGGGEYLPLLFIAELQKRGCQVTLVLDQKSDVASAARNYNVDINLQELHMELIRRPKNRFLRKLNVVLPFYKTKQIKKMAENADVCISANNMFFFGKPSYHIVIQMRFFGDLAFSDYIFHHPAPTGFPLFKRKLRTFLAETILRPLLGIRSTRRILADPREHILVPSRYVERTMRGFYGQFNGSVFYPPTIFSPVFSDDVIRAPLNVVYLGRIHPEKRLEDIIEIVEQARHLSKKNLTLSIAGALENNPYVENLVRSTKNKPWILFHDALYGKDKERFLLSGTFAVHTRRDEEFGISVTEYLKSGCIPIVPDEGGTPEIVDNPALTYHTNEEAAKILEHLLSDDAFRLDQLNHCKERAKEFSFERYMERQHKILDMILGE